MFHSRILLCALAAVGVGGTTFLLAQPPAENPVLPAATANPEEASIRAALADYASAYRANDVDKLLTYWLDDAEFVDEDGGVMKGKTAIGKSFRERAAEGELATFKAKVTSIRFLRGDLAMVDGEATFTPPNEAPETGAFHSLWAKTDGGWKILSVRDLPGTDDDSKPESVVRLQPFEKLVGEFNFKDGDTEITLKGRKSNHGCFVILEQSVKVKGEESLANTIVIGWDPQLGQVRSWVFDSKGGFGEGAWQRRGNEWIVESTGVRSDGRSASGVNTWHFVDDDTIVWSATDREIDGAALPDTSAKYVRQRGRK